MNPLEQVEAARAALEQHKRDFPVEGITDFTAWWNSRKPLIEAVWESEQAAIDAGYDVELTADF